MMSDAPSLIPAVRQTLIDTATPPLPLCFAPGIQVDQIRLIYSGKQLSDAKSLSEYNVAAGGTIHMVLQLRGGGL